MRRFFFTAKIFILASSVFLSSFFSTSASSGSPRCFLHGVLVAAAGNEEKPSLSDMIRLNFDADNKEKCERIMTSYCNYSVKDKNYSPVRIKGSFKPNGEGAEEFRYSFSQDCTLQSE